jgi:uncharacterized membrane protein YdbT with pleckstrin-like domain
MSFQKDQLQPGEEIVVATRPHAVTLLLPALVFLGSFTLAYVLTRRFQSSAWLALALPAAAWFAWRCICRAGTEYIVTNHRVVRQEGVIGKTSIDAPLDKINNIFHKQNVFQKMILTGEVGLETASELGMLEFRDVPRPLDFKNAIVEYRERYKARESSGPFNSVEALERLARLKEQGFLTPEEFEKKKRQLLS